MGEVCDVADHHVVVVAVVVATTDSYGGGTASHSSPWSLTMKVAVAVKDTKFYPSIIYLQGSKVL